MMGMGMMNMMVGARMMDAAAGYNMGTNNSITTGISSSGSTNITTGISSCNNNNNNNNNNNTSNTNTNTNTNNKSDSEQMHNTMKTIYQKRNYTERCLTKNTQPNSNNNPNNSTLLQASTQTNDYSNETIFHLRTAFPQSVARMLECAEDEGLGRAVHWRSDGISFEIGCVDLFAERVLPMFFKRSPSYRRRPTTTTTTIAKAFYVRLRRWGFKRHYYEVVSREVKSFWSHPRFTRKIAVIALRKALENGIVVNFLKCRDDYDTLVEEVEDYYDRLAKGVREVEIVDLCEEKEEEAEEEREIPTTLSKKVDIVATSTPLSSKPKRPFSAYNLFYILERAFILHEISEGREPFDDPFIEATTVIIEGGKTKGKEGDKKPDNGLDGEDEREESTADGTKEGHDDGKGNEGEKEEVSSAVIETTKENFENQTNGEENRIDDNDGDKETNDESTTTTTSSAEVETPKQKVTPTYIQTNMPRRYAHLTFDKHWYSSSSSSSSSSLSLSSSSCTTTFVEPLEELLEQRKLELASRISHGWNAVDDEQLHIKRYCQRIVDSELVQYYENTARYGLWKDEVRRDGVSKDRALENKKNEARRNILEANERAVSEANKRAMGEEDAADGDEAMDEEVRKLSEVGKTVLEANERVVLDSAIVQASGEAVEMEDEAFVMGVADRVEGGGVSVNKNHLRSSPSPRMTEGGETQQQQQQQHDVSPKKKMPGKEMAKAPSVQEERHSTTPPETQFDTPNSNVRGGDDDDDDDDDASHLAAGYAKNNRARNKFQRAFVLREGLFGDDGAAQGGGGGGHSGLPPRPIMKEDRTTAGQAMETSKSDDDPSIQTGKKRSPEDASNQDNPCSENDIISISTNNNSNAMSPMNAGMTNIQEMMNNPNMRELMMMNIRMSYAGMGGGYGIGYQMNSTQNTPVASNQPTDVVQTNAGGSNNNDTANSSLEKRNYGMGNPMNDSVRNASVARKRNHRIGNQMNSSLNAFVAPSRRTVVHADQSSGNNATDENSSLGKRNYSMCADDAEGNDVCAEKTSTKSGASSWEIWI